MTVECPDCSSPKDTPITWSFCTRCTERRLTDESRLPLLKHGPTREILERCVSDMARVVDDHGTTFGVDDEDIEAHTRLLGERHDLEARLGDQARSQLDTIVKWLVDNGFPYDWHSTVPAPAFLRAPLVAEYAHRDGEDAEPIERYLETLDMEQEWR